MHVLAGFALNWLVKKMMSVTVIISVNTTMGFKSKYLFGAMLFILAVRNGEQKKLELQGLQPL